MKIISTLLAVLLVTSCSSPTALSNQSAAAVKAGMSREEVKKALGKPTYMYTIGNEETWVYSKDSARVALTKETSINMVPVAGPFISLVGKVRPKPKAARAEVTFDSKGKANRIRESKTTH